jgi:hypothetical protein
MAHKINVAGLAPSRKPRKLFQVVSETEMLRGLSGKNFGVFFVWTLVSYPMT